MRAVQIFQYFETHNIEPDDDEYDLPARPWLLEEYAVFFREFLRRNDIVWKPDFDCDNFAPIYRWWACYLHSKTKRAGRRPGLAVGEVKYRRGGKTPHHINFAISSKKALIFIEPQTQKEISLTSTEESSIYWVHF